MKNYKEYKYEKYDKYENYPLIYSTKYIKITHWLNIQSNHKEMRRRK